MITRLPEVDGVHKVDIERKEKKLITKVFEKLDLVNYVNIEILGRIGTKKDNLKRPLKLRSKVFQKNTKYWVKHLDYIKLKNAIQHNIYLI